MARRKRGLARRLMLHGGLWIDAIIQALCDPRRPHQRVFVDAGGMYSFGYDWPSQSQRGPLCHDEDLRNRVMRLEAENVYFRERIASLEAKHAKRKKYHKFHAARSWGR